LLSRLSVKASDPDEHSTPVAGNEDDAVPLLLCLLIVSGWEFEESQGASHTVAWCSSCNRRWSVFPDVKSGEDDKTTPDEPARKRAKRENPPPVDLLAQHRPFCPWTHGQSAADAHDEQLSLPAFSRLPGWDQYCQVECCVWVVVFQLFTPLTRLDGRTNRRSLRSSVRRTTRCRLQSPHNIAAPRSRCTASARYLICELAASRSRSIDHPSRLQHANCTRSGLDIQQGENVFCRIWG
jgi:hypothetical protein